MKFLLAISFALIAATSTYSQVITYDDFKTVIPYMQQEDYKGAFDITDKLLKSTQNDSSDLRGIVIYMNILSAAGMVGLELKTHDDFLKIATGYIGQWVVMSAHPCIDSTKHGLNTLVLTMKDGHWQGSTTSTNIAGSQIFCFEYFKYAEPIDPSALIGKIVRCGGILEAVEINPNKSRVWISRLHIANAFARVTTPR
jgi:hypothetical protein